MQAAVAIIGILIVILGATGVTRPKMFLRFYEQIFRPGFAKHFVAASMFIFGAACFLAAPECRFPGLIRIFGFTGIANGLVGIMLSREFYSSLISGFRDRSDLALRGMSVLTAGLGVFLAYGAV